MPRTRKRVQQPAQEVEDASTPVPPETNGIDTESRSLQFDEPLNWRAGRPIAVGDLLSRLQALFAELCEIDQDEADRESLTPKAQELANAQLLGHKDKGVRAWALQCIVKMFHLLAPNAPYKAGQLRDIFSLFSTQIIPAFADSTSPYAQQHVEILTSFANDKSVLLILDIPASDSLVHQIFQNAFDVMAGNGKDAADRIPRNVEYQLTALLVAIVEEAEGLPNEVIDVILAQFLRADSTLMGNDSTTLSSSPAYEMARALCNSCATKMTKYISTYYSSVLIDASQIADNVKSRPRGKKRKHEDDDDDSGNETLTAQPSAEDFEDAAKAHRLLRELWRSSPDVVQGVVPQIEAEVGAEDAQLRIMAVQAIGDLISGIGATEPPPDGTLDPASWPSQSVQDQKPTLDQKFVAPYSFSKVYPDCYQAFIDRHRDKASGVRAAWVIGVGRVFATNAGGKGLDTDQEALLLQYVNDCTKDNDESVRLATIKALNTIRYPMLIKMLSKDGGLAEKGSLLDSLADRVKDPRSAVRAAAIDLLSRIWGVAVGAIALNDVALKGVVGAIPSRILDARYLNLPDVNHQIAIALYDLLLPVGFPPIKGNSKTEGSQSRAADVITDPDYIRAERVLVLVSGIGDRAEKVFFGLQVQQAQKAKYLSLYLDRCEAVNTNAKDTEAKEELEKLIGILSKDMLEPQVAMGHLKEFAKQNDRRNYQLIRFCLAAESDYRKVVNAMKEFNKRLRPASATASSLLDTLSVLLKSASLLVSNRSHVPTYMRFANTDEKGLATAANKMLEHIAATSPSVFKIHAAELCQTLQRSQPTASTPSDPAAILSLKTCVGFARQYPKGMPKDRAFYQAMSAYALYGSPPKTAKYAVSIIIAAAESKEMYVDSILNASIKNFTYGEPHFLSRLAALAQLQLLANEQTQHESDEITMIAVKKILQQSRTSASDQDPAWSSTEEYDEDLISKLLAIKILVNGLRGRNTSDDSQDAIASLRDAAAPVYRLLNTLIDRDGEISKSAVTPRHHRAQLRLAAGVSLLKLCTNRNLDRLLSQADFHRLAVLCQDEVPEVRSAFAKALRRYLGHGKLPSRFLSLVFLYAFDHITDIKASMETWIRSRVAAATRSDDKADTVMEAVFARFLSLLAHYPEFSMQKEHLSDTVHYIVFYLTNVATEANIPILYNIAQRLKTVQDGIDESKSDNLYVVSDVAEATIRAFHEEKGWVLQAMSEKIRLPAGLFTPLSANIDAQELAEKRFLSEDMLDLIPDLVRAQLKPRTKRRKVERTTEVRRAKELEDESAIRTTKRASTGSARKRTKPSSQTPEPKSAKKAKRSATHDSDDGVRRRSSRNAAASKSYIEQDSDDEDEELEQWNDEDDKENHEQQLSEDTPPTSEPPNMHSGLDVPASSASPAKTSTPKRKTAEKPAAQRKPGMRSSARQKKTSDVFDTADDST